MGIENVIKDIFADIEKINDLLDSIRNMQRTLKCFMIAKLSNDQAMTMINEYLQTMDEEIAKAQSINKEQFQIMEHFDLEKVKKDLDCRRDYLEKVNDSWASFIGDKKPIDEMDDEKDLERRHILDMMCKICDLLDGTDNQDDLAIIDAKREHALIYELGGFLDTLRGVDYLEKERNVRREIEEYINRYQEIDRKKKSMGKMWNVLSIDEHREKVALSDDIVKFLLRFFARNNSIDSEIFLEKCIETDKKIEENTDRFGMVYLEECLLVMIKRRNYLISNVLKAIREEIVSSEKDELLIIQGQIVMILKRWISKRQEYEGVLKILIDEEISSKMREMLLDLKINGKAGIDGTFEGYFKSINKSSIRKF